MSTYPGLPDGIIDWWVPGISDYDGTLTVLKDQVGVHDGATKIDGVSFNGSHVAIMKSEPDFSPPWFCSLGNSLLITPLPAINPDAGGDFRGSNPYTCDVTWSGSPWWSSSSVTLNFWALCNGAYGTSGSGTPFESTLVAWGDERSNGSSLVGFKFWVPDGTNMFFDVDGLPRQLWLGTIDFQWHMYTITSDGTTIFAYIDGVLNDGILAAGWADGDHGFHFGSRDASGPSDIQYAYPWNGNLGDVQVWDRPLSGGEVNNVFTSGCFPCVARIKRRFKAG